MKIVINLNLSKLSLCCLVSIYELELQQLQDGIHHSLQGRYHIAPMDVFNI
jgi:hypothetical protein